MLVLKEENPFRLFNIIVPAYLLILFLAVVSGAVSAAFFGLQPVSIVIFSFTLVLAEFLRRKNLNGWYIFLSGGLQYSIQTLLLLNVRLGSTLGIKTIIFISVCIPAIVLLLLNSRVVKHAILNSIVRYRPNHLTSVISESIGQLFFNLTTILNNWLGTYLLSLFGNLDAVAIFAAVKRITNGLSFPQQVLNINLANPLARAIGNKDKLRQILLRQRRMFFYTSIVMGIGALVGSFVLTDIVKVPPQLHNQLWMVYFILSLMIVLNVLTGPTFIFARIVGGLRKKVLVLIAITLACYGLALVLPIGNRLIAISGAAFCSMTTINLYLMYTAYKDQGLYLHAKP